MGDIIKKLNVRVTEGYKSFPLSLYFDNGSPFTYLDLKAARKLGGPLLEFDVSFSGLGDGKFHSTHIAHIEVRLSSFRPSASNVHCLLITDFSQRIGRQRIKKR